MRVQSLGREQSHGKSKTRSSLWIAQALHVMYVAIILENDHAEYMDQGVCPQDPVSEEESE